VLVLHLVDDNKILVGAAIHIETIGKSEPKDWSNTVTPDTNNDNEITPVIFGFASNIFHFYGYF